MMLRRYVVGMFQAYLLHAEQMQISSKLSSVVQYSLQQ